MGGRATVEWGGGRRQNPGGSVWRPQAAGGWLHFRSNLSDSSTKITIFPDVALERCGFLVSRESKKYWFSKDLAAFLVRRRLSANSKVQKIMVKNNIFWRQNMTTQPQAQIHAGQVVWPGVPGSCRHPEPHSTVELVPGGGGVHLLRSGWRGLVAIWLHKHFSTSPKKITPPPPCPPPPPMERYTRERVERGWANVLPRQRRRSRPKAPMFRIFDRNTTGRPKVHIWA